MRRILMLIICLFFCSAMWAKTPRADSIYLRISPAELLSKTIYRDPTDGHVYIYIALKEINEKATDKKWRAILKSKLPIAEGGGTFYKVGYIDKSHAALLPALNIPGFRRLARKESFKKKLSTSHTLLFCIIGNAESGLFEVLPVTIAGSLPCP